MKKIVINGKFLAQRVAGVQRYAREVVSALDSHIQNDDVELLIPQNAREVPIFKHIKIRKSPLKASLLFEQVYLPLYTFFRRATCVNLCHVAPILNPGIVCIHDANVLTHPQWFPKKLYFWYKLVQTCCGKFSKKVLTVSDFSKAELKQCLSLSDSQIVNIGSGWQHFLRIECSANILNEKKLKPHKYYFSLGTQAQYKNMHWVYEIARRNPQDVFVMSGAFYNKVFKDADEEKPSNVLFLGYLSDFEVKTLMRDCKAFLFPSLYEGFGIPPLEAMSTGCPIVVSDIPVMHEIFETSVHYVDPYNTEINLEELLRQTVSPSEPILKKYSWEKCAQMLWKEVQSLGREND